MPASRMLLTILFGVGALAMVLAAGNAVDDAFAFHAILFAVFFTFMVIWLQREPHWRGDDPHPYYDDRVIKALTLASVLWLVLGFGVGVYLAFELAFPDLNMGLDWLNFGRLRPLHTTGVIFAFGGNALIATSFHVLQRTCRVRLAGDFAPWFVFWGYQLFLVIALTGYMMGVTQSKEYAEPEWYADIWLALVWLTYLGVFLVTLARRREPHIYVSNWYFLAFIVAVAMLHVVNNLAVPVSWFGSKSYIIYAGVQDAVTQWWYGHNAVAFFLTAGFLGMFNYYLPRRLERPLYSYRLSVLGFWSLIFLYLWAGPHHLHYTAVPDWVQFLAMSFSIMLWMPSWATVVNGLLTFQGKWHRLKEDPVVRFLFVAAIGYGVSTFEGPLLAIRVVNALSHYTDWTVGHVHAGALGWVAPVTFGALYHLIPVLYGRENVYCLKLVNVHFWLLVAGTLFYVFSMWISGITQGLMWRAYSDEGNLLYSFAESVEAMHPYYVLRAIGGVLNFIGLGVMIYNLWRTARPWEKHQPIDITKASAAVQG